MTVDRRQFLRHVGGGLGLGLAAATAGCTAPQIYSSSGSGSRIINESDFTKDEFDELLRALQNRWGEHSVFGRSDPPTEVPFVGAWYRTNANGFSENGEPTEVEYVLARYELESDSEGQTDIWVLWAAGRPTVRGPRRLGDGPFAAKASFYVRSVGVGVSFNELISIEYYAPRGSFNASEYNTYAVDLDDQYRDRVQVEVPLPTGRIHPKPPRQWSHPPQTNPEANSLALGWQGRSAEPVSMTDLCVTALPSETDPSAVRLNWHVHDSAGGYLRL